VNESVRRTPLLAALLTAGLLLITVAWLRGAEYDEQYTLFLTGGMARPVWPSDAFVAGKVREAQAGHASFAAMARDLRATDVHPPLYFWALAAWRRLAGSSLFAARLASVLLSVVTLCLVAVIARSAGISRAAAVLFTVGCYGFAYTGSIARGFALAQMLSVAGIAVLVTARDRPWRPLAAGALLGAATFANYLAAFVACAALVWLAFDGGRRRALLALVGLSVWLPPDLWFLLAQRNSRGDQFASFQVIPAFGRVARYVAANLFGGLPLYVDGVAGTAVNAALAVLLIGLATLIIRGWRDIATPRTPLLLILCAAAPPIGVVLLGVVFNNEPIELRYLCFATPYVGLLLAAALPRYVRYAVLAVQAIALLGLMTRPETMQPARATALAAASLAHGGVVLVPHGNDGVGIVGAFGIESPPALRLLVVRSEETPAAIRGRTMHDARVVLALLGQDAASRATLPVMRQAFADPCWQTGGQGFNVLAFDRICGEACACPAQSSP
jgi:hypothetical protein